ncbi:MAG: phosphatidate cytidylyltransferase [Pseudomonadota bacterium]
MIGPRIATGTLLIVFIVGSILYLPEVVVQCAFVLALFLAAREWGQFFDSPSATLVWAYALITVFLALALSEIVAGWVDNKSILLVGVLWWLGALIWLLHYQFRHIPSPPGTAGVALIGWFVFLPAWFAIFQLLRADGALLLLLFMIVWSADTAAYFVGREVGKHPLAPRISPGKTWEGVIGGVLGAALLVGGFCWWSGGFADQLPLLVLLIVLTTMASILGDLLESLLKRHRGLKDSGAVLPGHGGVLDRLDSTFAAAPVFALGYLAIS